MTENVHRQTPGDGVRRTFHTPNGLWFLTTNVLGTNKIKLQRRALALGFFCHQSIHSIIISPGCGRGVELALTVWPIVRSSDKLYEYILAYDVYYFFFVGGGRRMVDDDGEQKT